MAKVRKLGTELRIDLSARDIREAAIDAAWGAAVKQDSNVAVQTENPSVVIRDSRGGYRVAWNLKDAR